MRADGCEVWLASLTELERHLPAFAATLLPAERADLGAHAKASTGTLSRAVLRLVLARHLGRPAAELEIDRRCPECGRPHGRPRLRNAARAPEPDFSVSHGGDLLVVALVDSGRVGVDVEADRSGDVVEPELLELTLTATERRHVASVPDDQRRRLFLHYWTAKEAVLKALGTGLDLALQAVTLPPPPEGGTTHVTLPGSAPVELTVRYLDVGAAHVCALATGGPLPVRVGRLSPTVLLAPPQASVSSSASTACSP